MSKIPHIEGELLVSGKALFTSDIPKSDNLLYVYPVLSPISKGKIKKINIEAAKKIKGFVDIITYKDIPGQNDVGEIEKGEPLFPEKHIEYYGQPLCAVICKDYYTSIKCASLVKIEFEEEEPILTIEDAIKYKSFFEPVLFLKKGNTEKALKESEYIIEGEISTPVQEHFYMETQCCRIFPDENGFIVNVASQSPSEIQGILAAVLGIPYNCITVDIKRLGGGFGGKEHSPTIFAAIAALACYKTKKPVELRLLRDHDIISTGKRHYFKVKYRCGFFPTGEINAVEYEIYSNAGAYVDLSIPVLERCILNVDGCYNFKNLKLTAKACKTNLHPFTAFRGFGAPQGSFFAEHIIEKVAEKLKADPFEIRKINLYKTGDITPYGQKLKHCELEKLFQLVESTYNKWKRDTETDNKKNRFIKKGIGVTPIKFGISFTTKALNRGYCLIILYPDGSVSVSHGGVEMGQQVSTRIAQIVSKTLGITIDKIRIESVNTKRIANIPPTAASTAVDLNGNAALKSAKILKKRLEKIFRKMLKKQYNIDANFIKFENNYIKYKNIKIPISKVIETAIWEREKMAEYQFYKTPKITGFNKEKGKGVPFLYYVHGIALSQVETDLLTGEFKILKTKIIHETGRSLNKEIEIGQIAGAFIQGAGWLTIEEMKYQNGKPITISPSTYKIPTIRDIPDFFEIKIIENNSPFSSVFGSKGIGEPPFLYGTSVFIAIKNSLQNVNLKSELIPPATPEAILNAINGEKDGRNIL